ncbi:MAG: AarF/ABC1/UbiB kinase family protein [Candidatus Micrarchaeota archaeon]
MSYFSLGYKHFGRVKEIYRVLAKHGFIEVVDWLEEGRVKKFLSDLFPRKPKKPLGERIRVVLTDLGPTFIKFGQILSTRADLLPPDVITELVKLQDQVPEFSFDEVKQILKEEYGDKKVFKKINPKPIAAASIGQVHKAVLMNGTEVVIKIQRPGIQEVVEEDLQILLDIARFLEANFAEAKYYQPVDFVRQFSSTLRKEMDYVHELRNAQKFAKNFEKDKEVRIPCVYPEFTTKKVLVLEYLAGVKITSFVSQPLKIRKLVVERGANLVMKQVLKYGFFQADPHAGNLMVLKNNVIGIVDFGMVGHLDHEMREQLCDLFISLIEKNSDKLVTYFLDTGLVPPDIDLKAFKSDVDELIDQYYDYPLEQIRLEDVFLEITSLARQYKVRMQPKLLLLFRLLVTLDGVGRQLYPEFNSIPVAKPYVIRILQERHSPSNVLKRSLLNARDVSEAVARFPLQLSGLLSRVQKGNLEVSLDHKGLEENVFRIDRAINKISLAVMTAGLFLGASILAQLEVPPLILGLSWTAWIGFFASGFIGFLLIVSILLSKEF